MKDWMLRASRWNEAGTYLHADYGGDLYDVSIRCSLPGWLQKAWFVTRARNRQQALNLHQNAHGQRVVFYDAAGPLLTGFIMAVEVDGRSVRFELAGTYACRMKQAYYQPADPDVDATVPAFMQDLLSTVVPAAYVSPANFATNTQKVGDSFLQQILQGDGVLAEEVIQPLLDMSNDTYDRFNFWFQARPWSELRPVYDAAHYAIRENSVDVANWLIDRRDMVDNDAALHSHAYEYHSTAVVNYGKVRGTSDYVPGDYYLHDTDVDFLALGVRPGDMATDLTKSAELGIPVFMYISAVSEHVCTGGSGYNWWGEEGEPHDYVIRLSTLKSVSVSAVGAAYGNLWENVGVPFEAPELDQFQGVQKAEELLSSLSRPIYQTPFTIGSPGVRHGKSGANWPLWRLLHKPSYLAISNGSSGGDDVGLALGGVDLSSRRGFFTQALDYNGNDDTLSVTPNEPFPRLDLALKQLGVTTGETVDSGRGVSKLPFGSRFVAIVWDWSKGAPYPGWEDEMRALGLTPYVTGNPADVFRNWTPAPPNPPSKGR